MYPKILKNLLSRSKNTPRYLRNRHSRRKLHIRKRRPPIRVRDWIIWTLILPPRSSSLYHGQASHTHLHPPPPTKIKLIIWSVTFSRDGKRRSFMTQIEQNKKNAKNKNGSRIWKVGQRGWCFRLRELCYESIKLKLLSSGSSSEYPPYWNIWYRVSHKRRPIA